MESKIAFYLVLLPVGLLVWAASIFMIWCIYATMRDWIRSERE